MGLARRGADIRSTFLSLRLLYSHGRPRLLPRKRKKPNPRNHRCLSSRELSCYDADFCRSSYPSLWTSSASYTPSVCQPRPSMTASSTLPSISRLPVLRTGSTTVLSTTASFTVTFSQPTTLETTSSRNNGDISKAPPSSSSSYSSMSSLPPTTNSVPTSVVTVEVSSSGDDNNNNNGQSYPLGLILGIVTGFSILILVMGIMFLILWRNRHHVRPSSRDEANEALVMSRRKRKKGPRAAAAAEPCPLSKVSVDSDSTGSEDAERPLPTPPSSRRGGVSKQAANDERREGRNDAHMRCQPASIGTSVVPVRSSRDFDAAGDRTGKPPHRGHMRSIFGKNKGKTRRKKECSLTLPLVE